MIKNHRFSSHKANNVRVKQYCIIEISFYCVLSPPNSAILMQYIVVG